MARPHSTKPRSPFAARLIEIRKAFGVMTGQPGIDQRSFAKAISVGDEAYRRYERGETEPKLATLTRIRMVTGIPLDWLICGIAERGQAPTLSAIPGGGSQRRDSAVKPASGKVFNRRQ